MSSVDRSKKRYLVIGINCLPELTGIGRYTGEMVNWFEDQNAHCTVVTTFPYYPYWKVQKPYRGKFYRKEKLKEGDLTLYRCPFYVPAHPTGLKRVIHEASFFLSAFFVIINLLFLPKHDEIICIAPPFHLGFLALLYRFFKGGKLTYHIQDLQIEAARDLEVLKPLWIFDIFFAMERFILNRADQVSTISEGMQKKVAAKTRNPVVLFPNWSDTRAFYPLPDRDQLKLLWNYQQEDKVVLYSGSIGEKQGLEVLLEIARELKGLEHIKLLICGTGPYKEKLKQRVAGMDLKNVLFLPLQENEVFNKFLNMADVHLVLQKADASDLVMPSKLTNILSAGALALVTANPGTTLHEVVTEHQMGVVIPPEDKEALKQAIVACCSGDYSQERRNARKYAEEFLDQDTILHRMFG
ncbi:WcaI family glycosyltransferase [Pedobacter sp. SYSU D00535]|uniref:WcaI family glycosyltransferase n=1 Tax=Pedobacter sp. SYSU D00535 TaxID=2810308 RepID=UPI001A95EE57|nr:WcaI family glycosyltransferase [Pedobacter sp. SYSU D00535]